MTTEPEPTGYLVVSSSWGAEYDPAMPQDERKKEGVYARWLPTLQEAQETATYWVTEQMLINVAVETDDYEKQIELLRENLPETVSKVATHLNGINTSYTFWGIQWIGLFEGKPSDNNWGQVEAKAEA